MRTAVWLYLFIFIAFFDLHAQYPILSPFALSLGAVPSFIGLMMGVYSITHLPGNVIAGVGVDKYGSKPFIIASLIGAGCLLILQSQVTDPWQLLAVRSVSGFVLAFLSPACMSLLAKMAKDRIHQGKLMAGNGLVHTLASVVSPAAGAFLVAKLGFTTAFSVLGIVLIGTALLALVMVKEIKSSNGVSPPVFEHAHGDVPSASQSDAVPSAAGSGIPWRFYAIPLAISCSQGILFFELPLMKKSQASILHSGLLFSVVSLGALLTLSMLFLNRFSPYIRTISGSMLLALGFFAMSIQTPLALPVLLFIIGMAKGVIFPALSTLLVTLTDPKKYGRVFSILSIAFSIGAFIGPIAAGHLRDGISPFFLASLIIVLALSLVPPSSPRITAPVGQ